MSTIADCLASGPAASFDHAGRTYRVSYLDQDRKADFVRWVRSQAMAVLPGLREALPPDEYEAARERLIADVASGRYGFHGPVCQAALKTPDGSLAIARILAGITEDEAVTLMVECRQPFLDAVGLAMKLSRPRPKDAPQGNAPTPAA